MIYAKLLELQKKEIKVSKNWNNPFTKSKYVLLDDLIETYQKVLTELQLVMVHSSDNGALKTTIYDCEDKTFVESSFPYPETTDPQKIGSSISYGKRYNLGQLLNIVTDEDDDGNTGAKEANKQPTTPKTATKSQGEEKPRFNKPDFEKFKQGMLDGAIPVQTYDESVKRIEDRYKVARATREELQMFFQKGV